MRFHVCSRNYRLMKQILIRCLSNGRSKVPFQPIHKAVDLPAVPKIDKETIQLLERLSLVDFSNLEAVERLQEAVKFASAILTVNTDGVKPMVTVLEDIPLYMRKDEKEICNRKEIMQNAVREEEGYFVAPPGNVPLDPKSDYVYLEGNRSVEEQ